MDEEEGKQSVPDSEAGKSDVTNISPSDLNLDEQVLSQIEEEIGESTSGSLVDLLKDQKLSEVSTSGVILRVRPKSNVPLWVIGLAVVGGALLLLVLVLIAAR